MPSGVLSAGFLTVSDDRQSRGWAVTGGATGRVRNPRHPEPFNRLGPMRLMITVSDARTGSAEQRAAGRRRGVTARRDRAPTRAMPSPPTWEHAPWPWSSTGADVPDHRAAVDGGPAREGSSVVIGERSALSAYETTPEDALVQFRIVSGEGSGTALHAWRGIVTIGSSADASLRIDDRYPVGRHRAGRRDRGSRLRHRAAGGSDDRTQRSTASAIAASIRLAGRRATRHRRAPDRARAARRRSGGLRARPSRAAASTTTGPRGCCRPCAGPGSGCRRRPATRTAAAADHHGDRAAADGGRDGVRLQSASTC